MTKCKDCQDDFASLRDHEIKDRGKFPCRMQNCNRMLCLDRQRIRHEQERTFYCSKAGCEHAQGPHKGFHTDAERHQHEATKQFECELCLIGEKQHFHTKAEILGHQKYHVKPPGWVSRF